MRRLSEAMSDVVPQQSTHKSSSSDLKAGMQIEHERFGLGTIEKIEGTGENTKATVRFNHAGQKQLLLKFARFRIVDNSGDK